MDEECRDPNEQYLAAFHEWMEQAEDVTDPYDAFQAGYFAGLDRGMELCYDVRD